MQAHELASEVSEISQLLVIYFNWCIEKKIKSSKQKGDIIISTQILVQRENLNNIFTRYIDIIYEVK